MMESNIQKLVANNWEKSKFISLSLDRSKVKILTDATSFLDDVYSKVPLRTRAYVIKNSIDVDTLPRCVCGKPVSINKTYPELGFRQYCGPKCSRVNKTIDKVIIEKLDNYNFLYEEKIVKQKSIEQIAKEHSISSIPVVKFLKKHNLYQLNDARRRNNKANQILEDRDSLMALYETNTMQNIAESLGTTKGTVSRWFEIHNITAKSPNSYERKIKKISKGENEIYEYIQSIYSGEIYQSNRSVLSGKELDIYVPEKNLAIEYNGLYSHCYKPWEEKEYLRKDSNYHLYKTIECEKQGIQLLQFYSDEWEYNSNVVKNIIKSKLGINDRIYARKCNIIKVNIENKNLFLNNYHLQGEDKSSVKLGLEYNNELVCVMTFAKSRFNKLYQWELTRFCVKGGISVVGGFSKLLKFFTCNYDGTIVSYADRRYSNGAVYKNNGFKLIGVNKPSYYYTDKNFLRRFNRMRFQKKYIGAHNSTEYEKARELGYEKIWDCGVLSFGYMQ